MDSGCVALYCLVDRERILRAGTAAVLVADGRAGTDPGWVTLHCLVDRGRLFRTGTVTVLVAEQ